LEQWSAISHIQKQITAILTIALTASALVGEQRRNISSIPLVIFAKYLNKSSLLETNYIMGGDKY